MLYEWSVRISNTIVSLCCQRHWKVKNDWEKGTLYEASRKNDERNCRSPESNLHSVHSKLGWDSSPSYLSLDILRNRVDPPDMGQARATACWPTAVPPLEPVLFDLDKVATGFKEGHVLLRWVGSFGMFILISKEETEIQWKSTCLFPLPQKRALRTCWMLWCEIITQASNEAGLIISFLTLAIAGLCWCHFLSFSLLWLTLPALGSCLQAKMMLEMKSWPSLANLTRCSKEIWTKMFSLLKKNIQTLI